MGGWMTANEAAQGERKRDERTRAFVAALVMGLIVLAGGVACLAVGAWSIHRARGAGSPEYQLNSIGGEVLLRFGAALMVIAVVLLICAGIARRSRHDQ